MSCTDDSTPPKKSKTNEEVHPSGAVTSSLFPKKMSLRLYDIECKMIVALQRIDFRSPVACVYNPLEYADTLHCAYLEKYLDGSRKDVLFVGMNPGPWGMCQTGVPFGHIPAVRDWMRLTGHIVRKPAKEIASRPVTGLDCTKHEQSGQRFWGLLQSICGENASVFFRRCFVHNFCPLAFFHQSGRNITPAELKGTDKDELKKICSQALGEAIELISPKTIISVGRYVESRIKELSKCGALSPEIELKYLTHPSPRSLNNTDWCEKTRIWFCDNNLMEYLVE